MCVSPAARCTHHRANICRYICFRNRRGEVWRSQTRPYAKKSAVAAVAQLVLVIIAAITVTIVSNAARRSAAAYDLAQFKNPDTCGNTCVSPLECSCACGLVTMNAA